ncbi:Siroheme synthase [Diplonema papillatum]|nr:Siroheme synthase [Diplonema papillatum]
MAATPAVRGCVAIVGAGPGGAGLLTLDAVKALREADVCFHDRMVPESVLGHLPAAAARVDVGKDFGRAGKDAQRAINALVARGAMLGKRVVRLQAGDPSVYGRLHEQLLQLARHSVPYTIIPGVTAASAASAAASVPLTVARAPNLLFSSAQNTDADLVADVLRKKHGTVCLYMGTATAHDLAKRIVERGAPADTPVVSVANAARPNQAVSPVSTIGALAKLPLDARKDQKIFLIGEAVKTKSAIEALRSREADDDDEARWDPAQAPQTPTPCSEGKK